LNIVKKRGPYVLLLILFALVLASCMPRTAASNAGWTTLTAEDGVVYVVLPTGTVLALDATDRGAELWRYPVAQESGGGGLGGLFGGRSARDAQPPLQAVFGTPEVTGDMVLATTFDGLVYAFNRTNGRVLWTLSVDEAVVGGVTVHDGVAYYGSSDYAIYAVDIETQDPVWDEPFKTGNWVWGAPAVDDERVYVGSMDRHVYAIDRATGREVWRADIGSSVPGRVTLSNGVLFVGGVDNRLHALDKETGQELWQTEDLGGWVWGEAFVHEGVVYFGSLNGQVHARQVSDGAVHWSPIAVDGAVRAGPAFIPERELLIVATNTGSVYTIQIENGMEELIYNTGGTPVLSTPAIEGDTIYLGTTAGNVYALDLTRRDPIVWTFPENIR
jgi:outer membrane protein assembly factor BamB